MKMHAIVTSATGALSVPINPEDATLGISVFGTYSGQLQVRGKIDGNGQWQTLPLYTADGAETTLAADEGADVIADVAGYALVEVSASAWTSGEAKIVAALSKAQRVAGGATGGDVTLQSSENHIGEVGGAILNPSSTFTRPADTTAYASGDLVANDTVAGNVVAMQFAAARVAAGSFMIRRATLSKSGTGVTNAIFRLHLYRAAPTAANGDNGAFSSSGAAGYIGALDITVDQAFTDGAFGASDIDEMSVKLDSGQMIYGLLEARGAYAPGSSEAFTPSLDVIQN